MADTAVNGVFDTIELLENILLQLQMQELFEVQQVCKQWRDTTTNSPNLQQEAEYDVQKWNPLMERMVSYISGWSDHAWKEENASWRQTYLFMPPVRKAILRLYYDGVVDETAVCVNKNEITLGDVWNTREEAGYESIWQNDGGDYLDITSGKVEETFTLQ